MKRSSVMTIWFLFVLRRLSVNQVRCTAWRDCQVPSSILCRAMQCIVACSDCWQRESTQTSESLLSISYIISRRIYSYLSLSLSLCVSLSLSPFLSPSLSLCLSLPLCVFLFSLSIYLRCPLDTWTNSWPCHNQHGEGHGRSGLCIRGVSIHLSDGSVHTRRFIWPCGGNSTCPTQLPASSLPTLVFSIFTLTLHLLSLPAVLVPVCVSTS